MLRFGLRIRRNILVFRKILLLIKAGFSQNRLRMPFHRTIRPKTTSFLKIAPIHSRTKTHVSLSKHQHQFFLRVQIPYILRIKIKLFLKTQSFPNLRTTNYFLSKIKDRPSLLAILTLWFSPTPTSDCNSNLQMRWRTTCFSMFSSFMQPTIQDSSPMDNKPFLGIRTSRVRESWRTRSIPERPMRNT